MASYTLSAAFQRLFPFKIHAQNFLPLRPLLSCFSGYIELLLFMNNNQLKNDHPQTKK
jgi:hypothetical protein